IAVSRGGGLGVSGQAGVGVASAAIEAEPTGHVERENHAVALLDLPDSGAYFLDDAKVLMAEDDTRLRRTALLVHVKIAAADRGCGDRNDGVIRSLDLWIGTFFDGDFVFAIENDCLHEGSLRRQLSSGGVGPLYGKARKRLDGLRVRNNSVTSRSRQVCMR